MGAVTQSASFLWRIYRYLLPAILCLTLRAEEQQLKIAFGGVPPLSIRTPEGKPAGFTVDVLKEAARREGLELVWVPAGSSAAVEAALKDGTLDISPAGMVTSERQRVFYVSAPWWFADLSILTRAGQGASPADFAGKRLALASPIYRFLVQQQYPGAIQVPLVGAMEAALSVCRGQADGALMMQLDAYNVFFARPDACRDAAVSVTETNITMDLAVIARRGVEGPARRLRGRIDEMALDGTLGTIAARYPRLPTSGAVRLADDLRARFSRRLWRTIAICALLMFSAGVWVIRRLYRENGARRRAQAELQSSQARLARAHRIASLADWEIDLARGEVDFSEDARALFGHEAPNWPAGWDVFLHYVAADDAERVRIAFERAAAGHSIQIDYAINHPERGQRFVRQHAEPIRAGGQVSKIVGTIQDITEHRGLEDQLRQAQKMESVGQLAGGVAHDFNNLLTVISGYAGMVLDALPPGDRSRESVGEIERAAARAAALTRQLLMFSRRQVVQPRVISVNALVRDLERMLRRLIGEDIELVLSLDPETASTRADPGQIEQVVVNLTINARDAMPNGGKVVIQTAKRRLTDIEANRLELAEGDYVELIVTDTGVGIKPEIMSRIFEPFFTTKERGKGTGLGLSTVYGIVKQSGGAINVRSEDGAGATFEVLLPETEAASSSENTSAVLPADSSGYETILVAEDEAGVRRFIRDILLSRGYFVLEAANGREALLVAEKHSGPIDLLLTDVIMPEMGGVELTERFSELRPRTAIVYMSGYTDHALSEEMSRTFLQKPFTPDALLRRVRESLPEPNDKRLGSHGTSPP